MINITKRARRSLLLALAISLCGSVSVVRAQHGSSGGGGVVGSGGAVMKLPAKKPTRPAPTSSKPKPGTRPQPVDNSQLEDALSLADDARQAGRNEAAERGYQLASKLAPTDPRSHLGLGHTYYNQKKYAEAEKAYARAASLSQNDSEPYARLAFTYSELQRLDEALAAARKSVAAQSDNYYGYLALGYVFSVRRSYAEAEAAYRKSVTLAPQPLIVLQQELVRILSEQRRYADAAKEAKKGIEIAPQDYSARFSYAIMLQKLGQLVPSAEQYLEAIKLDPKDGAPHSNIGLIYYMSENFASAREHWTAAVGLGSTYQPDRIGLLILDRRFSEAQAQLEEYTRKSGDDEDGWLMLGDLYRALGNDSAARVADARAAQIAPEYVGLRRPDLKKLRQGGSSERSGASQSSNNDVLKVNDKGQTTLMVAASNGRADLISDIVAAGVAVDARDNDGDAALYYTASNGHADAALALLKAGANPNAANDKGSTALIGAAVSGHTAVVQLLLARGARVDQADKDGDNALILASAVGKAETIDALLKGRANINVQNKNGITPLIIASFQGHTAVVRLLLDRGANVNLKARNGLTALTAATSKSHPDIAEILRNAGARN